MNNKYPFISYPHLILRYGTGKFPELDIIPEPIRPIKEDVSSDYKVLIWIPIYCAFHFFIFFKALYISILFIIIILVMVFLWVKKIINNNKDFIKREDQYVQQCLSFEEKVEVRNKFAIDISNTEFRKVFVRQKILEILESTKECALPQKLSTGRITKKGISEKLFRNYLTEIFENNILAGYGFALSQNKHFNSDYYFEGIDNFESEIYNPYIYEPDFIFCDKNLFIDIEIDEPYIYESGAPIHYFDEYKRECCDDKRNSYFNERGWCVIRFAEKQVIENPYGCCLELAKLIYRVSSNAYFLEKLKSKRPIKELERINFWTINQAMDWAESKYRDTYLKSKI